LTRAEAIAAVLQPIVAPESGKGAVEVGTAVDDGAFEKALVADKLAELAPLVE
jgi:hypothetical protein